MKTRWLIVLVATLLVVTPRAATAQEAPCWNALPGADPGPTVCISRAVAVFDGQSEDNQFYVSWRSIKAETGQVRLNGGETFEDVRGAGYSGVTHYVRVNNLTAKTTYQFDIVSGGAAYTHGGAHWTVKLGPVVQTGTPYVVYGRTKNPDGSSADGVIVLAQVRNGDGQGTDGRSGLLSALVVVADGGDLFNINLDDARTQDGAARYAYSATGDRVFLVALGPNGRANKTFSISDVHPPAAPPSLILNPSGTGSAVTATPTATQTVAEQTATATTTATADTPTPTVTLTPSDTPVPPATETELAPEETEDAATATVEAETSAPDETEVAANEATPGIGSATGEEVEPPRTRVSRGVPDLPTLAPAPDNRLAWILLAAVLLVGAGLLGAAAFFIKR